MKVFQIFDGQCHWDATALYSTVAETEGLYTPDIVFVEAPDYVREGWGYDEGKEGDERFIQPEAPEGYFYDLETGEFVAENDPSRKIAELKDKLAATDYQAIKYAEGLITAKEYEPIKKQRQEWRNEINDLEKPREITEEEYQKLVDGGVEPQKNESEASEVDA